MEKDGYKGVHPEGARAQGRRSKFYDLSIEEQNEAIEQARSEGKCGARPMQFSHRDYPCQSVPPANYGGQRCRRHGGLSPGGAMTAGGMYSKRMKRLRASFQEAMTNPEMWDLTPSVALHDVRIGELIEQVEANDSPAFRATCNERMNVLEAAIRDGNPDSVQSALRSLQSWIRQGNAESGAWNALLKTAQDRSHRVEKAADVALKGMNSIPRKDVIVLFGQIIDIIIEESREAAWANRIVTRLTVEVMGGSPIAEAF